MTTKQPLAIVARPDYRLQFAVEKSFGRGDTEPLARNFAIDVMSPQSEESRSTARVSRVGGGAPLTVNLGTPAAARRRKSDSAGCASMNARAAATVPHLSRVGETPGVIRHRRRIAVSFCPPRRR